MKILLIEDSEANIQSAKDQFQGHEITIITNLEELLNMKGPCSLQALSPEKKGQHYYDLVLTDMYIPNGKCLEKSNPNELAPVGLVVYSRCKEALLPCVMVTESNGHKDVLGLACEDLNLGWIGGWSPVATRPAYVATEKGAGKDWLRHLKHSGLEIAKSFAF